MIAIQFVCLGNICRSPMAEGIFTAIARERWPERDLIIASAGTGGWHAGNPPDPRACAVAAQYGVDISQLRARRFQPDDFHRYDLILAMDAANLAEVNRYRPGAGGRAQTALYLDYALGRVGDVEDPYYGGAEDFEAVYALLESAARALIDRLDAVRPITPGTMRPAQ